MVVSVVEVLVVSVEPDVDELVSPELSPAGSSGAGVVVVVEEPDEPDDEPPPDESPPLPPWPWP